MNPNGALESGPRFRATRLACGFAALIALLWLTDCSTTALLIRGTGSAPVRDEVAYFKIHGRQIRVDVYKPETIERLPAAILLHGSNGIHAITSNTITRYAQALAHQGIIALVVHYFDATGDVAADDSVETANYFRWVKVLHQAVTWARGRPDVDKSQVGLVGYSLGAWLGVGAAAFDSRIKRVVLFGAGLEPFLADKIQRMPPTLIFHGDQDDVVPLSDATHLVDFLRSRNCPVELRVYHGEGHTFDDSTAIDALERAGRFLTPQNEHAGR